MFTQLGHSLFKSRQFLVAILGLTCTIFAGGYRQLNNSNSNQVAWVRPSSSSAAPKATVLAQPTACTKTPMAFDFQPTSVQLPHMHHKSPIAAPRQTRDQVQMSGTLYENIDSTNIPIGVTPPSRCSGYSSGSRGSSENDLTCGQLDSVKSIDMIPDDLTVLSVTGLADCLHLFELHAVAHKFRQHQIDGQFFKMMNDQMYRDSNFGFTDFEILKLKQLRDGWRPRV